jgi:molybdopterin/thiamine biosynthesis adenylyltransferase
MRDARHLALPQVGAAGQERIANSTALLIGVGGIGCATASYLAASGVGRILLCDFDNVDATNLGRQVLYGPGDIGELKAEVATSRLSAINPDIEITASTCLISGAAIRLEGQVTEFGPDYSDSPCYRCLYKEADESLENCAGNGVLGPVPGTIGALMAVEALKFLAGIESRRGILRLFDAISGDFRAVTVKKRDDCAVCSSLRA